MPAPLVSIVCLCYNQEKFVEEAIQSVLNQSHKSIQLLVVDDSSTDHSAEKIEELLHHHPLVKFVRTGKNLGHCKAFNHIINFIQGEFIIDLAADDVLLPERVEFGIKALQQAGPGFGVHFSDAEWINEKGGHLHNHSRRYPHYTIPKGDIYIELITRHFICPPTVMFNRTVLDTLGGYDEKLSYEDFDFWMRSSRQFKYCYSPEILVKKRVVRRSHGQKQFQLFNRQSESTYLVCKKIMEMNQSKTEQGALSKRLLYEMRLNARLLNFGMVKKYFLLWNKNRELNYRM